MTLRDLKVVQQVRARTRSMHLDKCSDSAEMTSRPTSSPSPLASPGPVYVSHPDKENLYCARPLSPAPALRNYKSMLVMDHPPTIEPSKQPSAQEFFKATVDAVVNQPSRTQLVSRIERLAMAQAKVKQAANRPFGSLPLLKRQRSLLPSGTSSRSYHHL